MLFNYRVLESASSWANMSIQDIKTFFLLLRPTDYKQNQGPNVLKPIMDLCLIKKTIYTRANMLQALNIFVQILELCNSVARQMQKNTTFQSHQKAFLCL